MAKSEKLGWHKGENPGSGTLINKEHAHAQNVPTDGAEWRSCLV